MIYCKFNVLERLCNYILLCLRRQALEVTLDTLQQRQRATGGILLLLHKLVQERQHLLARHMLRNSALLNHHRTAQHYLWFPSPRHGTNYKSSEVHSHCYFIKLIASLSAKFFSFGSFCKM